MSVKERGLAAHFRCIFLNVFAIVFINFKLFLILYNNRVERGMKEE